MSFWTFGLGEKGRKLLPYCGAMCSLLSVISTSWSVFYPLLQVQFGMDTVAPFAIGSSLVGGLGMTLGPLIGGPMLDKFGPKINFLMNAIWYLLAMICMFQIENYTVWEGGAQIWYILGSSCTGMGAGTASGTISASVSKWNPDNLGWAVAVDNLGPALAPVWVAPFAAAVVPQLGIGKGFMVMFILGIIGYLVFGFLPFSTPPEGWQPRDVAAKAQKDEAEEDKNEKGIRLAELGDLFPMTFGEIMKTYKVWVMFFCVFLACFCYMGFTMNLSTIMKEAAGQDANFSSIMTLIASALSFGAIANAIGRLCWGKLIDKIDSAWGALRFNYLGVTISLLGFALIFKYSAIGAVIFVILIYFCGGGSAPMHMSCAPYMFGTKNAGKVITVTLMATGVAWFCAPYAAAIVRDIVGTYYPVLFALVVIQIITVIIACVMHKKIDAEKKEIIAKLESGELVPPAQA